MSCTDEDFEILEHNKNENRRDMMEEIFNQGFIKYLITIFCICIAFICFYFVFSIFKLGLPIFVFVKNPIFDPALEAVNIVFYYMFALSILIGGMLFAVFHVLYSIYKKISPIPFIGWIIGGIWPFPDCLDAGLFRYFDNLYGAFGYSNPIRRQSLITVEFLREYFRRLFGVATGEGDLAVNEEFVTATTDLLMKTECGYTICEERVAELKKVVSETSPLVKINIVDKKAPPPVSEMARIKINNCIRQNTVDISNDTDTITRLKLLFSNEIERQNCHTQFSNPDNNVCKTKLSNPIKNMENVSLQCATDSVYNNSSNFFLNFDY
jgi:hypothetical protein